MSANATAEDAAVAAIEGGRVEELREVLPQLYAEAARPAGLEGVVAAFKPWFATFPQPERDEAEWLEWWSSYASVCGHHSQAALSGALKAWAAKPDSEFLPKPGALSELARTTPTAAFRLAGRVHQILQIADDRTDRQRIAANMERDAVKPADQVQAVAELLASFQAQSIPIRERAARILQRGVGGADIPDADLPYIGGECATGSALTPQMLKHMGWPVPPPRGPRQAVDFDF